MNIDYIFMDEYTPKERRKLLMKEYVREGLLLFGGNRKQTSNFLGMSPRTLRIFMADNPELREEFPANVHKEHPYCPQPKDATYAVKANRNYKSLLKYQYKIKNKTFDSLTDVAKHYAVSLHTVELWVKNKMTDERDMVRILAIPINWDGSICKMD